MSVLQYRKCDAKKMESALSIPNPNDVNILIGVCDSRTPCGRCYCNSSACHKRFKCKRPKINIDTCKKCSHVFKCGTTYA